MGVLFTLAVERIPTRVTSNPNVVISLADYGSSAHLSENALTHWEEQVAGVWPVREKVGKEELANLGCEAGFILGG